MSVLLTKILWYKISEKNDESSFSDNEYKDPINITDAVTVNAGKGLDIKNNILSLTLKNSHEFYIDNTNDLKFEEQDQIKIYLKYTDDGADVNSSAWDNTSTTVPSSSDMIGIFYVIEFSVNHTTGQTLINLSCADKTYILFNRVLAKAFLASDNLTAPTIIQKIVRFSSQNEEGKFIGGGSEAKAKYDIDAKLVSDGGYITDTRRNVKEDGTANTTLSFPEIDLSKVWKPIYEWLSELSQVEKTNTSTELGGTLVYGRPFIFWVDEENRFHWIYPDDTVANYIETGLNIGDALSYDASQTNDAHVRSVNLAKKVFDVTNMIIFNAGTDMYGTGMWDYEVDTTSRVKSLKMRVVPMIDISEKAKNDDYSSAYNPASTREGTPAGKPLYQFVQDVNYPLSVCAFIPTETYTTASTITNDTTYNAALIEWCLKRARNRAKALLAGLANARWKGSITVKGKIYNVGNLVEFTDQKIGLYREYLRIMDVRHTVNSQGWTTSLTLEKDPEAVEVSV